ncbi:MAG: putative lipid II flippase FtsW [Desulfobacteraceae bacterium]|nr:putative lipid II flippase FtsW [Desulfobacteraceae bacterium]
MSRTRQQRSVITGSPRAVTYDPALLFSALFLVGIGVVMVYSASSALAMKKFGTDIYFLKKQALFSMMGIVLLVMCSHFPLKWYRALAYPSLFLAFGLLACVKIPGIGITAGGSSRWLQLGSFNFQPSEFARLALVLYLAYSLSKKQALIKDFAVGFIPHIIVLGIFAILLLTQPDFGSVVIFCAIAWVMMFVAGVRLTHLVGTFMLALPVGYWFVMNADYRMNRWISFLNPWDYPVEGGYQIIHSQMAFGTGGIWGTGIGKGYQKLFYLPEPHTDFIFSVIGEELGLIGVVVVLVLYAVILARGIRIARRAPDTFSSLTALGITTAIGLHVCINMGVTLGMLPTKGLTLPFLSYGGTSLLINMMSIGILINIGAASER